MNYNIVFYVVVPTPPLKGGLGGTLATLKTFLRISIPQKAYYINFSLEPDFVYFYWLQRVLAVESPTQQHSSAVSPAEPPANSTFDYLYEFSETRKVLEEFFKHSDTDSTKNDFQVTITLNSVAYIPH